MAIGGQGSIGHPEALQGLLKVRLVMKIVMTAHATHRLPQF
jgi:hypothetical protein